MMSLRPSKSDRSAALPWIIDQDPYVLLDSPSYSTYQKRPCLLCRFQRRTFYCQSCVQSGEFTHSDPRRPDTLSDKQLRLLVLQRRTQDLEKKILAENEAPGQLQLTLREQIKMTQQRIKYFDHLIKEKRAKVKKMREVCQNLALMNQKRSARLPKFQQKVDKMSQAAFQYFRNLHRDRSRFNEDENEVAILRTKRAQELVAHIYSINEVAPDLDGGNQDWEDEDRVLAESLADAIHTSFINGKWVVANEGSSKTQYRIVSALLSADGDYSAYLAWNAAMKQSSQSTSRELNPLTFQENIEMNMAFAISAGLTFTTQLILQLANIFDVILPIRLRYQDCCSILMTEFKFNRNVIRLNFDVLYLCLSQGVSVDRLKSKNLLFCLKLLTEMIRDGSSRVGRSYRGVKDLDFLSQVWNEQNRELAKIAMTTEDLLDDDESTWEEGDVTTRRFESEGDWDALNEDLMTTIPQFDNSSTSSMPQSPAQQIQSPSTLASSIVSSLWRGLSSQ